MHIPALRGHRDPEDGRGGSRRGPLGLVKLPSEQIFNHCACQGSGSLCPRPAQAGDPLASVGGEQVVNEPPRQY